jgi:sugar O-acyltransferase (sialic acid O-acetyltransferase NeuD family)
MSGVLVIGAGGHGKVVADILLSQGRCIRGFLDDDPATWGARQLGIPVLGEPEAYAEFDPTGLILGVGEIGARREIVARLGCRAAHLWCNAIHPRATVARSVTLGRGIAVMAGAVVNPDATLGDHCIVNTGATVDHDCAIGAHAHIAPGAHLAGGIRVGCGAMVGIGASVTPNQRIGAGAMVAAGAVVVSDVEDGAVVKGIPARP